MKCSDCENLKGIQIELEENGCISKIITSNISGQQPPLSTVSEVTSGSGGAPTQEMLPPSEP